MEFFAYTIKNENGTISLRSVLIAIQFVVLAAFQLFADVLLHVDFDEHPLGTYTSDLAKVDFPNRRWINGVAKDNERGEIVPGREGGGNALKMFYPAGKFGPDESAIQCLVILPRGADTAWASYWVKFEDGFDFVRGGKIHGLCGGDCASGGKAANGYNGWSGRIVWKTGGSIAQYVYHPAKAGEWGEEMHFNKVTPAKQFTPGEWHRLVTQIIMNTPGQFDGVIRSWFDGELSLERINILFRHTDTLKINLFAISTFFGGNDASWASSADTYITVDDFLVVSKLESSPYPEDRQSMAAGESARIKYPSKKSVRVKSHRNGIVFTMPESTKNARIEIFNAKGAIVARKTANSQGNITVLVKSKGMYIYKVIANGNVTRGTVIFQ